MVNVGDTIDFRVNVMNAGNVKFSRFVCKKSHYYFGSVVLVTGIEAYSSTMKIV